MHRRIAALSSSIRRTAAGTAGLVLLSACYSGVSSFAADPQRTPADGGQDDGADDGGSGGEGDWDVPASFDPDPGQIRLLSSHEYANTVRDLLGVEASPDLDFSDVGSGYDNGSNGQLGESLFSILYLEAERIAGEYVATKASQDFACFDASTPLAGPCAETIVGDLGRRAFRRPLDSQMRDDLLAFVAEVTPDADDSAHVMELLVTRLLMSPRFLYRTELGQPSPDDPEVAVLDAFERASLLSYALTGSMPDAELMADAEANVLDAERTRDHVRRLLDSEAGRAQMVKFFKQWLRVRELDRMAVAPEEFSKLATPALGQSLHDEFSAFIEGVVLDDGATLSELLTRSTTFADRHTAPLYGLASASDELEPLNLDPQERGGVLTLASVMAVHSSGAEIARDKPIRRGLLVVNQLLCEEIGLPAGIDVQSAAAGVMDEVEDFALLTTREQFELMMNQDAICETCHATFMPYGFLWSNFDALGQYQTHFGERLLDPAVDGLTIDGEKRDYAGAMDMVPALVQSEQVARCFSTHVLRYATGMQGGKTVETLADDLFPAFGSGEIGITELFEETLASPALYVREAR